MKKRAGWLVAIAVFSAMGAGAGTNAESNTDPGSAFRIEVVVPDGLNAYDAVQHIFRQIPLTVNYREMLSEEMVERLQAERSVYYTEEPVRWPVALREVIGRYELDFMEADAVVRIGTAEAILRRYETIEQERLQRNRTAIQVNFSEGAPLYVALRSVQHAAGLNVNFDYMRPEDRGLAPVSATPDDAAQEGPRGAMTSYATPQGQPVEWRTVLREILEPSGYEFVEHNGVVRPMERSRAQQWRREQLDAKPLVRTVVPIFYANPSDLKDRIDEMGVLSARGKLSLTQSPGNNTINQGTSSLRPRVREDIVVSDVEEHTLIVADWIRKLDVSDGQVLIEARILSIKDVDIDSRGIDWSGFDGADLMSVGFVQSWVHMKKPANLITSLRSLSAVETPIAEDINFSNDPARDYYRGRAASAVLGPVELSATLHALDTLGNTEVLSHPLVVLGNRTEGQIEVLDRLQGYAIVRNESDTQGGQRIRYSVDWIETPVGLRLWVSPEISPDGMYVRLSVSKMMSDLLGYQRVVHPDRENELLGIMAETSERNLDTRAIIRDGDTLVIGGLVRTDKETYETRIPILGSIPGLGRLFRYDRENLTKDNLVIMITPTILDEEGPRTGYEPASRGKADELSAIGTDYFYPGSDLLRDAVAQEEVDEGDVPEEEPFEMEDEVDFEEEEEEDESEAQRRRLRFWRKN